jgi:hypothetical protein
MTTNTPTLITIKLLASTAPSVKDVQAALAPFGTTLQYEAVNLVFNGNGLVPSPTVAAPAENPAAAPAPEKPKAPSKARKVENEQAVSRGRKKAEAPAAPKPISFTEGSDPEKIWQLIRTSSAMTSTQIREKLGLGSNIVNTTVYRLKNAGMIRPMSYNAPNGDTLYTSTEWDPKPVEATTTSRQPVEDVSAADLLSDLDDEVL